MGTSSAEQYQSMIYVHYQREMVNTGQLGATD